MVGSPKIFSLSVAEIDFYFINNTPVLVGGRVSAEFRADRIGLQFYCHLTHLDDSNFRENCKYVHEDCISELVSDQHVFLQVLLGLIVEQEFLLVITLYE